MNKLRNERRTKIREDVRKILKSDQIESEKSLLFILNFVSIFCLVFLFLNKYLIKFLLNNKCKYQNDVINYCRVKNWALKFGVDLWEFGKQATKMSEITRVRNYIF